MSDHIHDDLRECINSSAAYIAGSLIDMTQDTGGKSALVEFNAAPEAVRPAVAARAMYDLYRIGGKEMARRWMRILYAETGASLPFESENL